MYANPPGLGYFDSSIGLLAHTNSDGILGVAIGYYAVAGVGGVQTVAAEPKVIVGEYLEISLTGLYYAEILLIRTYVLGFVFAPAA